MPTPTGLKLVISNLTQFDFGFIADLNSAQSQIIIFCYTIFVAGQIVVATDEHALIDEVWERISRMRITSRFSLATQRFRATRRNNGGRIGKVRTFHAARRRACAPPVVAFGGRVDAIAASRFTSRCLYQRQACRNTAHCLHNTKCERRQWRRRRRAIAARRLGRRSCAHRHAAVFAALERMPLAPHRRLLAGRGAAGRHTARRLHSSAALHRHVPKSGERRLAYRRGAYFACDSRLRERRAQSSSSSLDDAQVGRGAHRVAGLLHKRAAKLASQRDDLQLGISLNDSSTPLKIMWNCAAHAAGASRTLGAIFVGYLGAKAAMRVG